MGPQKLGENGSSLMLVPAGVLVLMVLASISADSAVAFLAKRELQNQAAAAANDAVTLGLTAEALQNGAAAEPDPALVDRVVHRRLDGYQIAGMTVDPADVVAETDGTVVTVNVEGTVPYIFARAVPGSRDTAVVRATAIAELRSR